MNVLPEPGDEVRNIRPLTTFRPTALRLIALRLVAFRSHPEAASNTYVGGPTLRALRRTLFEHLVHTVFILHLTRNICI